MVFAAACIITVHLAVQYRIRPETAAQRRRASSCCFREARLLFCHQALVPGCCLATVCSGIETHHALESARQFVVRVRQFESYPECAAGCVNQSYNFV